MTIKQTKIPGLILLLAIGALVLVACTDANNPPSSRDPLTTLPSAAAQTTSDNEWDAATFFATTCASCHGPTGNGSVIGPALNRDAVRTAETEWLIETISNGRSGTAMPAWSVEFGGPLNNDQIAELSDFLKAGDWDDVGDIAADQPVSPMGPGTTGNGMGGGMTGRGMGGGMMGSSMGSGRQP